MLLALLAAHALLGGAILLAARRLGRWGFAVGALAPAALLVWLATVAGRVLDGRPARSRLAWIPSLGLHADTSVDGFSLLFAGLVAGIGLLVFAYAWHYLDASPDAGRLAGLLTLFAGAMATVVVADGVLLLFVGWELTSITSYLLIGGDGRRAEAREAARHALLVTAAGGLALLGGLVILGSEAGTYRLNELLAAPPSGPAVSVALVLVLAGAATKSAQVPFHRWLPGAMVAPTPVSAYLHSATMVKAGVYLVARLAPAFAGHGAFRPLVVGLGLTTMLLGGWRALAPTDLKQLLAHSTVSQLGFLVLLFGIGHPATTAAAVALLVVHALAKAALFLVVGIVDHGAGTRDLAVLPPLVGPRWAWVRGFGAVAAASMAAVPPLAGFVAKDAAYAALVHGSAGDRLVLAGVVAGSALTVAYALRIAVGLHRPAAVATVAPAPAGEPAPRREPAGGAHPHPPSIGFLAPVAPLVGLSLVLGLAPSWWSRVSGPSGEALDPAAHPHLVLWPGVGAPLALSLLTLALGAGVFGALVADRRRRLARAVEATAAGAARRDPFGAATAGLLALARRVAATVQPGSLPVGVGLALVTVSVAATAALVGGPWWPGGVAVVGATANLPVAALLVVAGLAATLVRRRYVAAVLLGVTGYAMALLFLVHGAPDLALTQFGVETLSVVVFLVVLRFLPDRFESRPPLAARSVRLAIAGLVGAFVLAFSLSTAGLRPDRAVSRAMVERAEPEGHGANVVNVILVDIRGFDTLGEVTVLVAAAVGVAALARSGLRPRRRP